MILLADLEIHITAQFVGTEEATVIGAFLIGLTTNLEEADHKDLEILMR
jgi:hypothetical protein